MKPSSFLYLFLKSINVNISRKDISLFFKNNIDNIFKIIKFSENDKIPKKDFLILKEKSIVIRNALKTKDISEIVAKSYILGFKASANIYNIMIYSGVLATYKCNEKETIERLIDFGMSEDKASLVVENTEITINFVNRLKTELSL